MINSIKGKKNPNKLQLIISYYMLIMEPAGKGFLVYSVPFVSFHPGCQVHAVVQELGCLLTAVSLHGWQEVLILS